MTDNQNLSNESDKLKNGNESEKKEAAQKMGHEGGKQKSENNQTSDKK